MFQHDTITEQPQPPRDIAPSRSLISALDVLSRLWRAKWWAVLGGISFVVLALLAVLLLKPSYEASAQVYIDPQNLQVLSNDLNPSFAPGDAGVVIIESQARIMQSASVLRAVVEDLDLVNDPEFGGGNSLIKDLMAMFGMTSSEAVDPLQVAVDKLAKAIYVVRADRTYIVEIYAKAVTAARSAEIANAVVSAYLRLREDQRTGQANSASDSLELRLDGLLDSVKTAEDAVEQFKVANNIVGANGSLLVESRLSEANLAVAAAAEAMNQAQVQRDQLAVMQDSPELFLSSPEATGSADLLRLRGDLDRAQAEIGTLGATLGARHPRLTAAQSQLTSIRTAISGEMQRLMTNAVLAYARAQSQHAAAVDALAQLTGQAQVTDTARVQLRQLEREADSSRAVYEEALARSRATREQGQVSTLNAQVISQASVPIQKKFPPPLTLLLPVALLFGLALGSAAGMAYDAVRAQLRLPANPLAGLRPAQRVPPARPMRAGAPKPPAKLSGKAPLVRPPQRRAEADAQ